MCTWEHLLLWALLQRFKEILKQSLAEPTSCKSKQGLIMEVSLTQRRVNPREEWDFVHLQIPLCRLYQWTSLPACVA